MKVLVADVAAMTDGAATDVGNLGEPQFQIPLSGWYWQIVKVDQEKDTCRPACLALALFGQTLPYLISPTDPNRNRFSDGYLSPGRITAGCASSNR
jgi:hypothetical protein